MVIGDRESLWSFDSGINRQPAVACAVVVSVAGKGSDDTSGAIYFPDYKGCPIIKVQVAVCICAKSIKRSVDVCIDSRATITGVSLLIALA